MLYAYCLAVPRPSSLPNEDTEMLFNSHSFILGFLPLSILIITAIQNHRSASYKHMIYAVSILSVIFYGFWKQDYIFIIVASMIFNYGLAKFVHRSGSTAALSFGIACNIAVLAYFKYYNFLIVPFYVLGHPILPFMEIALPLGISFLTFHQVSYLVDCWKRTVEPGHFSEYVLFITFFPHLIAGPIVRFSEIYPQLRNRCLGIRAENFAPGITLFAIGITKKVFIADQAAVYVAPVFSAASLGPISFVDSWIGALSYTMQLYFDFSGYSDMALGLALIFGIKLPFNFNSPYKSTSIIDFWRRWHISLSRFLRDYLYVPLGGNQCGTARRNLNLVIVMAVGGLWHGAGLTFLAWGLLHGAFLAINHYFRKFLKSTRLEWIQSYGIWRIFSWSLTMLAIMVAWVLFRSDSMMTAAGILSAMLGRTSSDVVLTDEPGTVAVALGLLLIFTISTPNSQQIIGMQADDSAPARASLGSHAPTWRWATWKPNAAWSAMVALALAAAISKVAEPSEFLYFRF